MFEVPPNASFPQREELTLQFWRDSKIFLQSVDQRKSSPLFSFYDGPPFATGLPHYGHLLAGTLKDVIPRYKAMKGFYVPRRFGWDCHGLPIENEIEKAQELSGAPSIENFGVGRFNEECRKIVLRYTDEWEKTVERMGRWVDFSKTWKTMDPPFMESVWWAFGQLFARGLVYEGFKVMPFSAKLGTPLSNFEANLNYKDVDDPSLYVKFPVVGNDNLFFLVWTTTPWTLPSNLALIVGPEIEYAYLKEHTTGHQYILAKARIASVFKDPATYTLEKSCLGKDLFGKKYEPLFPYYAQDKQSQAFRVIGDEGVSTEDGTGIVHAAPAFGEMDFFACSREGIEPVCPVDQNGKFTNEVPDYAGLFVKDADKDIIKRLKQEQKIFSHGQIHHRYPFCWRSDSPLIYKAVRTWFVAVEKIKDKMLACNDQIHWVPDHVKHGRFGKWLESARDWAISRNRYWGTPIPIWRSSDGEVIVISSIAELEQRTGVKVTDLHRHFIDDLTFEENGKIFKRIPEVFDCWFESGSMPYAQNHYPFENQEQTMQAFPADFIAEGLDQTRGWFYTLTVLAAALFDKPAFKNVIVNGIILAEDGAKMSKRLKNYPDPELMLQRYGADAVRLYLLSSPAVKAEDLRFSEKGCELIVRQALIPLWNSYVFLATYSKIYKWHPHSAKLGKRDADIDRWLVSVTQKLVSDVTAALDAYDMNGATAPILAFVEQLTNWYIRRNRSRFWSEEESTDRQQAFETLYYALKTLVQTAAPIIPFMTEDIYQQLRSQGDRESVHLCDYPVANDALRDQQLENEMALVQAAVSSGHALRKEHKIKVRQPLARADIVCGDAASLEALKRQAHLIADELNVKEVIFHSDEEIFVRLSPKPNFRLLGKKVGKSMQAVQKKIQELPQQSLRSLMQGGTLSLTVDGESWTLTSEDIQVERSVKEGTVAQTTPEGITIVLETKLNDELLIEGLARELVNKINTMRREGGYAVTDRITVQLETTDRVKQAFAHHRDYICNDVLAVTVQFESNDGESLDLNGEPTKISIAKAP